MITSKVVSAHLAALTRYFQLGTLGKATCAASISPKQSSTCASHNKRITCIMPGNLMSYDSKSPTGNNSALLFILCTA